jgi:hypothetical protein
MQFWSLSVVPRYTNFATPSKDLVAIFIPWLCPIFCLRHINIHLPVQKPQVSVKCKPSKPVSKHNDCARKFIYGS